MYIQVINSMMMENVNFFFSDLLFSCTNQDMVEGWAWVEMFSVKQV